MKLHESWWRRENGRPLVDNFAPVKMAYGGLDVSVDTLDPRGLMLRLQTGSLDESQSLYRRLTGIELE